MQILFRNKKGMQANSRALLMTKNEKVNATSGYNPKPEVTPEVFSETGLILFLAEEASSYGFGRIKNFMGFG